MNDVITIRHVVSMAGTVCDSVNQARLGKALVEIIDGPPAFQMMVNARKADPAWADQRERIDRTWSQADGIFTFVDLPPGPNYRLRVSLPSLESQYGTVETAALQVPPVNNQPIPVTRADVLLPPTRIHGIVTHQVTGDPIAGALVRLRGDTQVAVTIDDGSYELRRLVKGTPTLEAMAAHFAPFIQKVELAAGQDQTVNVPLQPQ